MTGELLKLENTCPDCPLRNIIDCDSARPTKYGTGLGYGETYVIGRYIDDTGAQVETRVAQPARIVGGGISSDGYMDARLLDEVNQSIKDCGGPEKRGLLRRAHCLGGMTFRAIVPEEIATEDRIAEVLHTGAIVIGGQTTRTKFRNR